MSWARDRFLHVDSRSSQEAMELHSEIRVAAAALDLDLPTLDRACSKSARMIEIAMSGLRNRVPPDACSSGPIALVGSWRGEAPRPRLGRGIGERDFGPTIGQFAGQWRAAFPGKPHCPHRSPPPCRIGFH